MAFKTWRLLIVLMMAEAVASLESGMVIAGMPRWVQIHGDPVRVGWLISSFLVVQAAAAVLGGRFGDLFGRRRILLAALVICGLGSLLSGLSPSLGWMIVGRAIQGVAGAIQPLCYGLIRENLPEKRIRFGVSVIVATAAVAASGGMIVGGYLTDAIGPQSIFLTMSVTASFALLLILVGVPVGPAPAAPEKIDFIGGVLFVPGTILLLLAVSSLEKGSVGVNMLATAGLGGAALLGWALYELRQDNPLIDVRLLGRRDIALANSVMALSALSLMQAPLAFSMLVQQPAWTGIGLGGTAVMVGWLVSPSLIVAALGSLLTGFVADRVGPRPPIVGGCIVAIGALVWAVFAHHQFVTLVLVLILIGLGNIAVYAGVLMVVVSAAPAERVSEVSGFAGVLRSLLRAVGTQLMMVLLMRSTVHLPGKAPMPDEGGYVLVLSCMAGTTVLALLFALAIRSNVHRKSGDAGRAHPAAKAA